MSEKLTLPAPVLAPVSLSHAKWEREQEAFLAMLPSLLETHYGQYVAVHEGCAVDAGPDRVALALRVLSKIGNVDIHVGWVGDEQTVARSGVVREIH